MRLQQINLSRFRKMSYRHFYVTYLTMHLYLSDLSDKSYMISHFWQLPSLNGISFLNSFYYFLVTLWKTFERMAFFDSKSVHTLSFLALLLWQVTMMLWTQLVEIEHWRYLQLPTTQAASYTRGHHRLKIWWPDIETEVWWRLDVKLMRVCMLPKICAMLTQPIILSLANNPRV